MAVGPDSASSPWALDYAAAATCTNEEDRVFTREMFRRIGDRWSLIVIAELRDGPVRFTTLLTRIEGISHRLLSTTLRALQRDGLATRTAFAEVPPRVEYQLTPLGASLTEPLLALATWGEAHRAEIDQHRSEYDERHK